MPARCRWERQPRHDRQSRAARARSASAWCSSISRCSRRSPSPRTSRWRWTSAIGRQLDAAHPRGVRTLRPAARSAPSCHTHVGRRTPARRDRALPAAGADAADHGRADLGADAAGDVRSCSRRCAGSPPKAAAFSTISHKLDEIRRFATRATVLARRSRSPAAATRARKRRRALARMMIGSDLPHPQHRAAHTRGDGGSRVADLTLAARRSVRDRPRRYRACGARR